jgi:hypothetical protein
MKTIKLTKIPGTPQGYIPTRWTYEGEAYVWEIWFDKKLPSHLYNVARSRPENKCKPFGEDCLIIQWNFKDLSEATTYIALWETRVESWRNHLTRKLREAKKKKLLPLKEIGPMTCDLDLAY